MFFKYFFAHFLMLRPSSAVLVLDNDEVVFRSFYPGSIDIQTESVLSAVWQQSAFYDNLSKYCLNELV